jgi:hypothetical protein
MRRSIQLASVSLYFFETGPEGPELEDQQVEKKYKAAQTRPKKLIWHTCPSGHGSDGILKSINYTRRPSFLPQNTEQQHTARNSTVQP